MKHLYLQNPNMTLKLSLTIKAHGFTLKTNSYAPVPAIIVEPNAGLDLVKQYIGGFYMEFYPDEQDRQVEFVLYNAVNLKSLVLHYLYINDLTQKKIFPEKYPRVDGKITPLGETVQILRWKENINDERFNLYKP